MLTEDREEEMECESQGRTETGNKEEEVEVVRRPVSSPAGDVATVTGWAQMSSWWRPCRPCRSRAMARLASGSSQ